MDQVSGGLGVAVDGENCLKEIANNYVEEEDIDNSSGEETDLARENGSAVSPHIGHARGGKHVLVENGIEDCRDIAFGSANDDDRIEVSSESSGEEHSGESSENDEDEDGEEEKELGQNHGTSARGSRETCIGPNGFVNDSSREHCKLVNNERFLAAGEGTSVENEKVNSADGVHNGLEAPEKSLIESEGGPQAGGTEAGPILRRRRGRPLKSSDRKLKTRAAPITPKLEEPRAVRINRGIKRRFPGDESEDSLPKRVRVRSIASVCRDFAHPVKGEDFSMDESLEVTPARKRGRPRKSDGFQSVVKTDEAEVAPFPSTGKRKMVEAVLDSDSLKRHCHGRNGPIYACNAEGCKKRYVEATALYTHARVHGDRPYVCHYEGCIKSFSERSKLKRHFLIHTGEKPFHCHYEGCGKAFSLDFNLRSHMKTHTGDYHECPYDGCDKRYCQEYKLRAHIAKEHTKPVKGTRKLAKVAGNVVRGTNGSNARDAAAAAAKKRELLSALKLKRSKLESLKEERASRIKELEEEKHREASELARIEQDLKKLDREQRQLEEGVAGSPALSFSREEDADDEEEEEREEGEDPSPSNGTAGNSSSSDEQQSRLLNSPLEYTAMGEGKDVVMFAHKLPTADQGARLVKTMEVRPTDSQQEPTTNLTPLLWLQGPPPHHGHLAQRAALRPCLRSRRPTVPDMAKPSKALKPCSSFGEKEKIVHQKHINGEPWSQGESSDSGLGKPNGVGKLAGVSVEGGSGKSRVNTIKRNSGTTGRGIGKPNSNVLVKEKPVRSTEGENGKTDQKPQRRDKDNAKAPKQQSGRLSSSEPVFVSMNPILLSSDHGYSPTDSRFLSNEGFPSLAQGLLRDRLHLKEAVKSVPGHAVVPKEKVYRSMNEVLHSSTDQGYSACSGLNEGFVADQAPSEQSFEPSAAQLFTYHEQPRLVD